MVAMIPLWIEQTFQSIRISGVTGLKNTYYVKTIATQAGLYQNLSIVDNAPICRDDAAQLIYNGIMTPRLENSGSEDPITGFPIKGYVPTGRAIYTYNRYWKANPDLISININPNTVTTEYGTLFLTLLGKSIGDAHDKLGQPIETIYYNVNDGAYYGDVYPYFTVIYAPTREIKMINLTSSCISAFDCNYGMAGSQITSKLGPPASVLDDKLSKENVFVYHFESAKKYLIIKFLDHTHTAIKNIHFSLAEFNPTP